MTTPVNQSGAVVLASHRRCHGYRFRKPITNHYNKEPYVDIHSSIFRIRCRHPLCAKLCYGFLSSIPLGDLATVGGSKLRKYAGDKGGATKGNGILGACVKPTAATEGVVTGTRTECVKRFWFLRCPKHQYMLSQVP